MNDPILNERLNALKGNLNRVADAGIWTKEWSDLFKLLRIKDDVKSGLDETLACPARDLVKRIEQIRDIPSITEAWKEYRKAADQSRPLFRECMEVLGGLAFRAHSVDNSIFLIADLLIHQFADTTRAGATLTVPAAQEAMALTLGRIIRLPFPEWTVWTLPLIAREYGQVVLTQNRTLKDALAASMPEVREPRVLALVTDAFATYLMGPAYACALIMLRLDPTVAHDEIDQQPNADSRARMTLRMLKRMNDEVSFAKPYTELISHLEEKWATMLKQAEVTDRSTTADEFLAKLLDLTWSEFYSKLAFVVRYPLTKDDGWFVSSNYSDEWSEALKQDDGQPLKVTGVTTSSKLRDALNAAWICRIKHSDKASDIANIAKAAKDLCEDIVTILNPADRPASSSRADRPASSSRVVGSPTLSGRK